MPPTPETSQNLNLSLLKFLDELLPKTKSETQAPIRSRDFSRERRLPLPIVIALIINMVRPGERFGYQEVIDRFFSEIGLAHQDNSDEKPPDKAAFCRARPKLPLKVFMEIFSKAVSKAEEMAAQVGDTVWHGFRVLAIDGTKKNMPYSQELETFFGVPFGASFPQMLTCALYDVLAKIPIDVVYGPFDSSERDMARLLYKDLGENDLLLMDRGFPSFELLAEMLSLGFQYMVRLPKTGMFKEVQIFLAKGRRDGVVTIYPPQHLVKEYKKQGKPIPDPIQLRVVKVKLPNGEQAIFATTLMDKVKYSLVELRNLYHLRWEEEEFYKLVKGLLDAENFRGKCSLFIGQELMAIHLYCLLTRILIMECAISNHIPLDQIPQQHSFLAVARFLDRIWVSSSREECDRWLHMCIKEISWREYKKRPGRSFPRKSKSSFGKWGHK